jgi:hypothetical protein
MISVVGLDQDEFGVDKAPAVGVAEGRKADRRAGGSTSPGNVLTLGSNVMVVGQSPISV